MVAEEASALTVGFYSPDCSGERCMIKVSGANQQYRVQR
jgi:hypothetical protein